MGPRALFDDNLALIDRIIGRVCAKAGLSRDDADDFASEARLALLENDCAILRDWQQRASLATYLTVIVQRLLADWRRQQLGKWRPSAEARRLGDVAVTAEKLLHRQGMSFDEALPQLRALEPSLTPQALRALVDRLPPRAPRARVVALDPELDVPSTRDSADARAIAAEARRLSERTSAVVVAALNAMTLEDRMIVRFHFGSGLTLAAISRMLWLPQRPLYRRLESIVARLREALRDVGIDAGAVDELIGSPFFAADFGLGKNAPPGPAIEIESAGEQGS
jgi:RNA polymerase sigma factor (sigma-70 family)